MSTFNQQFQALAERAADLLTGDSSPEMVEKIKVWAIYNHLHRTMPALTSHWNQHHPEGKAEIRRIFEEIRDLNEAKRSKPQDASE